MARKKNRAVSFATFKASVEAGEASSAPDPGEAIKDIVDDTAKDVIDDTIKDTVKGVIDPPNETKISESKPAALPKEETHSSPAEPLESTDRLPSKPLGKSSEKLPRKTPKKSPAKAPEPSEAPTGDPDEYGESWREKMKRIEGKWRGIVASAKGLDQETQIRLEKMAELMASGIATLVRMQNLLDNCSSRLRHGLKG
ncbi:hypothetical protein TWF481_000112 [Arthrobotrys musiformis]|uniref:Uncharacterized protein n=1 Tax=Arthrobotrys musiformis TaxID=47236 RepID=A0AAV9WLS4_9PEZI